MKSRIGLKYYCTDKDRPYTTYAPNKKKEGDPIPRHYASEEDAWNEWMNVFLQEVAAHPGQDVVWRRFPELRKSNHSFKHHEEDEVVQQVALWTITSRYCFE